MRPDSIQQPLPQVFDWNRPFFEGGLEERLMLQRCDRCRRLIYYPRIVCPHCLCPDTTWEQLCGNGEIYSYSIVWRPQHPAFEDQLPITLAVIDLVEGVQIVSTIVGSAWETVTIGAAVRVVFDRVAPRIALPKFELAA
jgi:hypothetical protein